MGIYRTLRAVADLRPPRRRISYAPHRQQVCELHLPDGAGPHPVAVVLHGGFWRAQRSRRYMRPLCADLARKGWAALNVEYRRVGRGQGGGWPETFLDVAAGIDALTEVADERDASGKAAFGGGAKTGARLDLTRVTAIGHSAGGHLALWAAARTRLPAGAPGADPRVPISAGVAALAAPSDLEATPELYASGGAVYDLMHTTPAEAPDDRYAFANPVRLLPIGIPILLLHGDADETVPVRRSRDFAERARAAGDDVTLIEPPGAGHRAAIDPRGDEWAQAVRWLTAQNPLSQGRERETPA